MKLATFIADGQSAAIGIVVGETVFDLAQAARRDGVDAAPFASMQALIDAGPAGLDLARSILARRSGDGGLDRALGEVALLAPLPVPMQIRDFTNFPAHLRRAPVGMRRLAARLAGAPKVINAGVDLMHKLGDTVAAGDILYRVHAEFPSDLDFARQACDKSTGFMIGSPEQVPQVFVEF